MCRLTKRRKQQKTTRNHAARGGTYARVPRARDIARLTAQFDISAEEDLPLRRFRYMIPSRDHSICRAGGATRKETVAFPSLVLARAKRAHKIALPCLRHARISKLPRRNAAIISNRAPRAPYIEPPDGVPLPPLRGPPPPLGRQERMSVPAGGILPPFTRRRRISNCPQRQYIEIAASERGNYIERGASRSVYRAAQRAA